MMEHCCLLLGQVAGIFLLRGVLRDLEQLIPVWAICSSVHPYQAGYGDAQQCGDAATLAHSAISNN